MNFPVPADVKQAAKQGLATRASVDPERLLLGTTPAGELALDATVTRETIGRVAAWFATHPPVSDPTPFQACELLLWGGPTAREWAAGIWSGQRQQQLNTRVVSADESQHVVTLWLSTSQTNGGTGVVDAHNHVVSADELELAAFEYMSSCRCVGLQHDAMPRDGKKSVASHGVPVGSIVFTRELQLALGLPDAALPVGWLVQLHIPDPADWEWVKKNGLMGSIGCEADLEPIDEV